MVTDREIALEQALVAFIGAVVASGIDSAALVESATFGLLEGEHYRWVGFPHLSNAIQVLRVAHEQVLNNPSE
ncbi:MULTISPECIES: hypothetical protein [Pseudomonas]|uniref:hypothetical protein n=1 Tax=Pseudomonas TaxID=286 RepID=UPI000CFED582|nr:MULTISPECIES: hypothetical protein [Pseudomonas]PRA51990.1 hypothetical protein CQZ98_17640 [Pseudomonas sp. MYb115]QXN51351.1 hypothetical protein KW062_06225 [Pseudomonas fluorescens]WSO25669.1 hypothetical protein VUJ50_06235 [Pseudomonas fluorescens]